MEVAAEAVEVVLLLALVNHETRIPSPAWRSAIRNIATRVSSRRATTPLDLPDDVLWELGAGQQSTHATRTARRVEVTLA